MSYSSARSMAQGAKTSPPDRAIHELADAITKLSRAIEQDIAKIEREIRQLK